MDDIEKLERAIIKAALARYPSWVKRYGEPKPWGHPQAIDTKAGWNLVMATKALYEATRKRHPATGGQEP